VSAVVRQPPGLLVSCPIAPVTVYVPTGSTAAYLPSDPTVTCRDTGPSMFTDPGTGRANPGAGPPTSMRRPVSVALLAGEDVGVVGPACVLVHAAARLVAARASITRRNMGTTIRCQRWAPRCTISHLGIHRPPSGMPRVEAACRRAHPPTDPLGGSCGRFAADSLASGGRRACRPRWPYA